MNMKPPSEGEIGISRPFVDQSISVRSHAPFSREVIEAALKIGSATAHEAAGRIGALPHSIKPVCAQFRLAGSVFTIRGPANDNLWLHRAIVAASPGDILVAHTGGFHEAGYWGEIMSTGASCAGLGGLVIDGCVRDGALLGAIGFPVFARGLSIRGTGKDFDALGSLNEVLLIGDVLISPGDLMIGDQDGLVCIPRTRVPEVLQASLAREKGEETILARLRAGENTMKIYNLDR